MSARRSAVNLKAGGFPGVGTAPKLPHKVIAGEGTHKAAPRVIRKLAKWLVQKGYDPDADYAVE
jgi:hypothetical protein